MSDCICDTESPAARDGKRMNILMPISAVQAALAREAECLAGIEKLPLALCRGRILASSVTAPLSVPPRDNSAMDGYGLRLTDLDDSAEFPVSQRVPAGVLPPALQPGSAARIFTGAPLPAGVDTIVPQEQVESVGPDRIRINISPTRGQNIRRAGEDVEAGNLLLNEGTRLEAPEMGLLASQGLADINVRTRLKVGILTSGDEIVSPGQELGPGQIYNANAFSLRGALERLGCDVGPAVQIPDSRGATCLALEQAARDHDLIVTSGGVSVGDEDHVRQAIRELGSLTLWGVAMKPGKPFAFGYVGATPVLGLPGNPMAALLTLEVLAGDYIRRLMGVTVRPAIPIRVHAGFSRTRAIPRQEYLRVNLKNWRGQWHATLSGSQGSGLLSVACRADGYLIIPPYQAIIEGAQYEFVHRDQLYR
ncbi:molybdopterin molybdenumtransferase MoeA [Marinobacter halodurans]|uniref:Molybdopterin molybdenumtransferase n=1 Tax=Marinobacter halodurans TaxID=2528979 RepID=A0ABY1ZK46_9GAMM|nr:gephyrin-like molybdotransferase Glp [Marinobacter halodurans]TBW55718.1 molybdopterin molybdenumtransferase MoeA [Marinobacter halodurans]